MAAPKDNGGFLQVPTPGGLAPLQKQTLNPVPTGSATGKKKCPKTSGILIWQYKRSYSPSLDPCKEAL